MINKKKTQKISLFFYLMTLMFFVFFPKFFADIRIIIAHLIISLLLIYFLFFGKKNV